MYHAVDYMENFLHRKFKGPQFSGKEKQKVNNLYFTLFLAALSSPVVGTFHIKGWFGFESAEHAINCYIFSAVQLLLIAYLQRSLDNIRLTTYLLLASLFLIFTSNLVFSVNEQNRMLWFLILYFVADSSCDRLGRNTIIALSIILFLAYFNLPFFEPGISTSTLYSSIFILLLSVILFTVHDSELAKLIKQLEKSNLNLESRVASRTKELEAEKFKLNQAQEITHIGSYQWNIANGTVSWSNELFRILNFFPHEFLPNHESHHQYIHHDDREKYKELIAKAIELLSVYETEYRIVRSNGEIRNIFEKGEVTHNLDGTPLFLIGAIQDITERKAAEAQSKRIQQELTQSQKMESLGHLTGGIAHDFNNLLGIINGYSELALHRLPERDNSKFVEYLNNIRSACDRASTLVSQMLLFSRGEQTDDAPMDLAPMVKDEISMLKSALPSSIVIKSEIAPDVSQVLMNPTHLHQIIMNLAINARDSMDGEGELSIKLAMLRDINTQSTVSHKQVRGDWVELSVSDTGGGITEEIAKNIFNPFFSTKEVGRGSGMGLSVIYRIMENHGGHILLESEPGKGATFRMLLQPITDNTAASSPATACPLEAPTGRGEKILVVDDEVMLAQHLCELLEQYGYDAVMATDSTDALELFKQDKKRYSLLITDQTMPKMTGLELTSELRKIRPDLPVIVCSGYSNKIDTEVARNLNIYYLDKPVDTNKLLSKIREFTDKVTINM